MAGKLLKAKTEFKIDGFLGIVTLKEWMAHHDAKSYNQIAGWISIIKDEEIAGFKTRGTESNWLARISNTEHTKSLNVLGCQIRAVIAYNGANLPKNLSSNVLSAEDI